MNINILINLCVIIICTIVTISICYIIYIITKNKSNKIIKNLEQQLATTRSQLNTNSIKLSFNECNEIIDYIIDDIWKNKYFLNYRLRELTIIPAMDVEMNSFVKEVIGAISDNVMIELLKYYSHAYIIQKITRKSQILFVDYTNQFKPNTK